MKEWWNQWSTKSKIFIGGTVLAVAIAIGCTIGAIATGGVTVFQKTTQSTASSGRQ